jgi:hypothetical protein
MHTADSKGNIERYYTQKTKHVLHSSSYMAERLVTDQAEALSNDTRGNYPANFSLTEITNGVLKLGTGCTKIIISLNTYYLCISKRRLFNPILYCLYAHSTTVRAISEKNILKYTTHRHKNNIKIILIQTKARRSN